MSRAVDIAEGIMRNAMICSERDLDVLRDVEDGRGFAHDGLKIRIVRKLERLGYVSYTGKSGKRFHEVFWYELEPMGERALDAAPALWESEKVRRLMATDTFKDFKDDDWEALVVAAARELGMRDTRALTSLIAVPNTGEHPTVEDASRHARSFPSSVERYVCAARKSGYYITAIARATRIMIRIPAST